MIIRLKSKRHWFAYAKAVLEETRLARDYAEVIISAVRYPMLVLVQDPAVVSASDSYLETFRVTEEEILDNLVDRLGNGQRAIPGLRNLLNGVAKENHEYERIGACSFNISGRRIPRVPTGPAVGTDADRRYGRR